MKMDNQAPTSFYRINKSWLSSIFLSDRLITPKERVKISTVLSSKKIDSIYLICADILITRYYLSNTNVDCVFHTNHCNKKLFSMNHIKMQFLYERIICIFFVWVSQHDTNQEKDVSTFVPIFTRNVVIMNQSLQFSRKDKKYFIKTHWVVSKINVPIAQGKKSFLMD